MKLYVMRHGPAEDSSPTGRDGDRALTPDGRNRTRAVAKALVGESEVPLSILSSPLVRALQTAEIVAAETDLAQRVRDAKGTGGSTGAVEIRREMAPGGDALGLVRELARTGRKRAMVVGHEPDLSMLVSQLVGRHPEQGMLKSMVVGIKVDPKEGGSDEIVTAFRFILDPKTFAWQRT
ncbi:MAG: histidine phosphatase family protein [Labilithrix sp.]|nr:histidine phosphatase family protein [Labilithrix sp.]MCW5810593.1 histidine phosphatase family protein [Labilithrix sp.]